MPIEVFLMVLGAALVHATWNALVKADGDRLSFMKIMVMTQAAVSLLLLPFVAFPAAEAWPYLIASAIVSIGYVLFLIQAYRSGDLSHAYPLARGIAPLIVAAVSVAFLGEQLSRPSQIAILLIGLGITSLSLTRGAAGLRDLRMVGFALGTGGFIAAYTLLDGLGARASGCGPWLHGLDLADLMLRRSPRRSPGCRQRNGTGPVSAPDAHRRNHVGAGELCVDLDDHLGDDGGAGPAGVGAARDQHHLRGRDRRRVSQGAIESCRGWRPSRRH